MSKIFAIVNQKGGVGKTTTCVNLAASLVATKRRVLLIDLDPQGNATMGSGVNKNEVELSVYDVLVDGRPVEEVVQTSPSGGYHVLPSNADVTAAEVDLLESPNKEYSLKRALGACTIQWDYILIDCPPSLNMLTVNALVAGESVIIPMQCEYYALEGLSSLMSTIGQIQQSANPFLEVGGILRTMYDPRSSLTLDVSAQLKQHFEGKLYQACIPRNVRLAEAPSYGQPALIYDKQSKGAIAYLAMAGEFIRRNEQQKPVAESAVQDAS